MKLLQPYFELLRLGVLVLLKQVEVGFVIDSIELHCAKVPHLIEEVRFLLHFRDKLPQIIVQLRLYTLDLREVYVLTVG